MLNSWKAYDLQGIKFLSAEMLDAKSKIMRIEFLENGMELNSIAFQEIGIFFCDFVLPSLDDLFAGRGDQVCVKFKRKTHHDWFWVTGGFCQSNRIRKSR